jgi:UDP-N-acetylmuramoyl-L-alanyl-D-glutamate--2,6-diaminopimelate ligase
MGKVAEGYADDIVLTNDNPRGEDPGAIIEDILAGIANNKHVNVETDRATAITQTIMNADQGDIVVVAGKGHETCQEIAGRRYPFSDRELVRRLAEEIQ